MTLDPTFRAYLVPGGALQEPIPGEIVSVPPTAEAGLGLQLGDLPELTVRLFG